MLYGYINLKTFIMETNESVKNVMCEEQQVMHPYFSEFEPIEVGVEPKRPDVSIEAVLMICGLSSILY